MFKPFANAISSLFKANKNEINVKYILTHFNIQFKIRIKSATNLFLYK